MKTVAQQKPHCDTGVHCRSCQTDGGYTFRLLWDAGPDVPAVCPFGVGPGAIPAPEPLDPALYRLDPERDRNKAICMAPCPALDAASERCKELAGCGTKCQPWTIRSRKVDCPRHKWPVFPNPQATTGV